MREGWLVNDCLTCIPGTKTFWHDLLENIPGLLDKTNGYTDYSVLADVIESQPDPGYIIRNATYFRRINKQVPQISLLQDMSYDSHLRGMQLDVCSKSTVSVFNSLIVKDQYPEIKSRYEVIPLGTNFDLFKPQKTDKYDADVIYIGSSANHPKRFDKVINLIENTNYTFNLVMKDDFTMKHPRVRVFNRITQEQLVEVINSSRVAICTSQVETLHLAGVECGACGVPIVATNTGIYYQFEDGEWGIKPKSMKEGVTHVLNNLSSFSPREFWLKNGLDKTSCMSRWKSLVETV